MSMENIAGARKPAKREDEHTVAGEHRMMRRASPWHRRHVRVAYLLPGHVIIRRAAWERCGGYDESMRGDATASQAFMAHPTYGDGGMAAAVRLRS